MTFTNKRALLKLAGWSTLAAAAAMVGCGKKEEPAPAPQAAAPAASSAPAKVEPLKIAFAYVGPILFPAEFAAPQREVTLPVTLDLQ